MVVLEGLELPTRGLGTLFRILIFKQINKLTRQMPSKSGKFRNLGFDDYLQRVRGLAQNMRHAHEHYLRRFLKDFFGEVAPDWFTLTAAKSGRLYSASGPALRRCCDSTGRGTNSVAAVIRSRAPVEGQLLARFLMRAYGPFGMVAGIHDTLHDFGFVGLLGFG